MNKVILSNTTTFKDPFMQRPHNTEYWAQEDRKVKKVHYGHPTQHSGADAVHRRDASTSTEHKVDEPRTQFEFPGSPGRSPAISAKPELGILHQTGMAFDGPQSPLSPSKVSHTDGSTISWIDHEDDDTHSRFNDDVSSIHNEWTAGGAGLTPRAGEIPHQRPNNTTAYHTQQAFPVAARGPPPIPPALRGPLKVVHTSQITDVDVICGSELGANHPGNLYFRSLIARYPPRFFQQSASTNQTEIARLIVGSIRVRGGRFLEQSRFLEHTWIDIGDTEAEHRTVQAVLGNPPNQRAPYERERYMHAPQHNPPIDRSVAAPVAASAASATTATTAAATLPMSHVARRQEARSDTPVGRGSGAIAWPDLSHVGRQISDNPMWRPPMAQMEGVTERDVLLGRGGKINSHFGNIRFRYLVRHFQPSYHDLPKLKKTEVARTIVKMIHDKGGRFLEMEDDQWKETSIKRAWKKTSQALREKQRWLRDGLAECEGDPLADL